MAYSHIVMTQKSPDEKYPPEDSAFYLFESHFYRDADYKESDFTQPSISLSAAPFSICPFSHTASLEFSSYIAFAA